MGDGPSRVMENPVQMFRSAYPLTSEKLPIDHQGTSRLRPPIRVPPDDEGFSIHFFAIPMGPSVLLTRLRTFGRDLSLFPAIFLS